MSERFTLVSFHAHPDDEALLTGGTLARARAEGHRVVLVVATAGESGLADVASGREGLGAQRLEELRASARVIGVARVEALGFNDSGLEPPGADATRFCDVDVDEAASLLARILDEEDADVLTVYDPAGGYGHPDHVQVHRVGTRAAELARRAPVVLEATIDRTLMSRLGKILHALDRVLPLPQLFDFTTAYTARQDITHAVDVRTHLDAKLGALSAHASQASGGKGPRTVALLLRLPRPLAKLVLGREWFREQGRTRGDKPLDDVFATVRERSSAASV